MGVGERLCDVFQEPSAEAGAVETLGMSHRFAVANSRRTKGMVEYIMREIVRMFTTLLNE